jgi:hypothetical protein
LIPKFCELNLNDEIKGFLTKKNYEISMDGVKGLY